MHLHPGVDSYRRVPTVKRVSGFGPLGSRLQKELQQRDSTQTRRYLTPQPLHSSIVDLAHNDYLNLSRDLRLAEAAIDVTRQWGTSSRASPLVVGFSNVHQQLADLIEEWFDAPGCLLWNSGYSANRAILGRLPCPRDLILADRLVHNSILRGARESGAKLVRFAHNDFDDLERRLLSKSHQFETVFVVTESVFSMDGDTPDLQELASLKAKFGFILIVDEAHAIGCHGPSGRGLLEETRTTEAADIIVGTAGKALGSAGAFIVFRDPVLKDWMINFSGEFIYSTFLPPSTAAATHKAIRIVRSEPHRREHLHRLAAKLRDQLSIERPRHPTAIIPFCVGDDAESVKLAAELLDRGWRTAAIRPPTVPQGTARLRISLNAGMSLEEVDAFASTLKSLTTSAP